MRVPKGRPRLGVESLEDRLTPSWGSMPPSLVSVGTATPVSLDAYGNAAAIASVSRGEVDWYKFTTTRSGTVAVATATPASGLDTVIGLYDAGGRRVAYDDDVSATDTDSFTTANLPAGTYYLGVTNYYWSAGGSYDWAIDAPGAADPVSPPPPPPVTATGAFSITLRTSGLTAGEQAIFQQAANRWAQVITGDLPDATYGGIRVDDVLIDADATSIDGRGGVLGQAGPDAFRPGSWLPIHGAMEFDSADLASLEASGGLYYTVLHEMGHVLGIGTIWEQRGLLVGAGTSNPVFVGRNAVAAYDALFHTTATAVPVENSGGEGTADAHWRESTFGSELMTGYLNPGANPLSRVTVASLADLGYQVNLNAADV